METGRQRNPNPLGLGGFNKYSGGNFDDFLKEEGIFEEVLEYTRKRLLISQLGDIVKLLILQETAFAEKIESESIENV